MTAQTAQGAAGRGTLAALARLGNALGVAVAWVLGAAGDMLRYRARRWRASLAWIGVVWLAHVTGSGMALGLALALSCGPASVAGMWRRCWPASFEVVASPWRRWSWRRWARRSWPALARECGLSAQRNVRRRMGALARRSGRVQLASTGTASEWVPPRLMDVLTTGDTLTLRIRARMGQTVEDLEKAAPAFAAAASAVSYRVKQLTPSVLDVALVMREALATTAEATLPAPLGVDLGVDTVTLGRRQDGTAWALQVRGRHTLVVGCSGSGKGSMLWGVCGGLAPAVRADLVRLWGVDLKRGVEVMMGRHLFCTVAVTPNQAIATLARLLQVIEERGRTMAGVSRLHQPRPGDPLHVLVIDELAALTAYSDPDTKKDAARLLGEILTQGRALGVVVLACVQDPRKEVVGMRGLFTQTIALRLRSADETRMVLGDGTAALAPAHRLSPAAPGSAWVVEEDGSLDRVRADYWPDHLVKQTAATYPALVVDDLTPVAERHAEPVDEESGSTGATAPSGRKPRTPRQPRTARDRAASRLAESVRGGSGPEAA